MTHLTLDPAVSAIAMVCGMGSKAVAYWGDNDNFHNTGMVERYCDLGKFADLAAKIEAKAWSLSKEGFPGVWAYEVDEPFGNAYGAAILSGNYTEEPSVRDPLIQMLGELAFKFFNQLPDENQAEIAKMIEEETGYRAPIPQPDFTRLIDGTFKLKQQAFQMVINRQGDVLEFNGNPDEENYTAIRRNMLLSLLNWLEKCE